MSSKLVRRLVAAGAVCALGAAGVAVSTADNSDRPASIADDPGPDPLAPDRSRKLATGQTPASRHGCGSLTVAFENPVAGYSICYPSDFGVLALTETAKQTEIDALEAAAIRLADSVAFPWEPGTLPLDAVARGATIIEIAVLPSFRPNAESGDCSPNEQLNATARICEIKLDAASASPDPTGPVTELLSVHDLSGKVAVARSHLPANASAAARAVVRSILTTLRPLATGSAK